MQVCVWYHSRHWKREGLEEKEAVDCWNHNWDLRGRIEKDFVVYDEHEDDGGDGVVVGRDLQWGD